MTVPALDFEPVPRPEVPSGPEILEEIKALDSTTIAHLKERAKHQLYFMAKGVMRYKDLNPRTHGAFCRFFQDEEKDRRLGLMPRGHLKSSIATEADSVRLACKDPDGTRILIVNEIIDNSVAFLKTIMQQFEKNAFLRTLFPELILDRFSGPGISWSTVGATLPRTTTYKEPTWMPMGIGNAAVSKHFSRIKIDDIIGLEAKKSPAKMREAINWNRNAESLAIDAYSTIFDWIGTRWLRNDTYGDLIERYGDRLAVFHRAVTDAKGDLIFPEKYNWKFLAPIRDTTPDVWYAQYMNDPQNAMGQDFDISNLRYYRFDNDGNIIFKVNHVENKWHWQNLDRILTVDPNSGQKTAPDEASCVVSGLAPDDRAFVLADKSGRPSPTELVDWAYDLALRWRPRKVVIEQAGQQNTLFYFQKKMKDMGMYFNVEPAKHMNRIKTDRIRTALEPLIATRRLYILQSMNEIRSQLQNFPDIKNDDRIDALSYGVEHWRKPMGMEQQDKNRRTVNLMLNHRNNLTGYSGVR